MDIRWRKLLVSLTIWLIGEVLLTSMGLDDMADRAEYLQQQYRDAVPRHNLLLVVEMKQVYPIPNRPELRFT
ncbi:hypothetical protein IQ266_22725 [filamentous cyanobacterium LEGE 11480]|uniref:Uncharacterized protein n=1 Tax=Romeriopsis navalis LEGE 11480 TaxID=2777977 RepID=A0A928VQ04_9CYAN|nr:hypothetical protein [Romeriopsis navalis]MBE9032556.1 hypothetical protein [Romeriopsis navalis LEGE 11480]